MCINHQMLLRNRRLRLQRTLEQLLLCQESRCSEDAQRNRRLPCYFRRRSMDGTRSASAASVPDGNFGLISLLGGAHYNFIREIPYGINYEIRTTIGGWEDKWVSAGQKSLSQIPYSSRGCRCSWFTTLCLTPSLEASMPNIPRATLLNRA